MVSLADIPVVGGAISAHPIIAGILVSIVLLYVYLFPFADWRYGIYNIPGPPNPSLFWGNLREVIDAPPSKSLTQTLH